jgi:PAS domain S-box-containing protein
VQAACDTDHTPASHHQGSRLTDNAPQTATDPLLTTAGAAAMQRGDFQLLPIRPHRTALQLAAALLLLSCAWIAWTDVISWPPSARPQQLRHALEDLAFAAAAAVLAYVGLLVPLRTLQRAETQWRHVMASLDDISWVSTAAGDRLLFINEAAAEVYGRPAEDFVRIPDLWLRVVHPDDRLALLKTSATMRRTGRRSHEYRIVRPDGTVRWLRDRAAVIRDPLGRPIALAGVATDITLLREREVANRVVDERLSNIVDTAMVGIITVDADQRIKVFNQAASDLFGLPAEEALGQTIDRFIPMRSRQAHRQLVDGFVRHGATRRSMRGASTPLSALRADGTEFPVEATISKTGDGGSLLMTVILRDLSQTLAVQEAARARERAELANRAKSEFIARMGHELRTPLNSVVGFAQAALADPHEPLSTSHAGRLEHVLSAGWHLLALIDDITDLSRVESATLNVQRMPVDVEESIAMAGAICLAQAQTRKVRLDIAKRHRRPLTASADPLRLRQVLVNLLSNAIKYNRPAGSVSIEAERSEAGIRIVVADTGVGMSEEQMAHLFEPFNRLGHEHSEIEGHGIGLVIVRQLLGLMNGSIEVQSVQGVGTICTVTLEAAAPDAVQEALPTTLEADAVTGVVLYIEDNPVNVILVEQALSTWPAVTVIAAESGRKGMALARTHRPDIVLVDMGLPDMDGIQLMRELREEAACSGVPMVALSADSSVESREAATAAGASGYWTKPFSFQRFSNDVAALLLRAGP